MGLLKAIVKIVKRIEGNRMKVSEIGYLVDFNNPKYFSKCFQKQFGVIPSRYKNLGVLE